MIRKTQFTEIQIIILRDVCQTQLLAVTELKESWQEQYPEFIFELEAKGLTDEDYFSTLLSVEKKLIEILDNPEIIFSIDIIRINTLLSIFNKMEEKYRYKYPVAISSLFRKFFLAQDIHKQPLNIANN